MPTPPDVVVFFDGTCRLCDHAVNFLLQEDRARVLRYAPLQGSTAESFFQKHPRYRDGDSVLVWIRRNADETVLARSDAALFLMEQLPRFAAVARLANFVPRLVRDGIYRFIAAIRFQVWGRLGSRRVPAGDDADRFLP